MLLPIPFFWAQLHSCFSLLPPLQGISVVGNGVCHQSVVSFFITLSLLLLSPQQEDSSQSFSAPAWGPSHRRKSSMNFSRESLPWAGILHEPQCGSLPQGHNYCQQTTSSTDSRGPWAQWKTSGRMRCYLEKNQKTQKTQPLYVIIYIEKYLNVFKEGQTSWVFKVI